MQSTNARFKLGKIVMTILARHVSPSGALPAAAAESPHFNQKNHRNDSSHQWGFGGHAIASYLPHKAQRHHARLILRQIEHLSNV